MAPPLLTPAQFARTPVGQKPGASYHGYVTYVTQTRAKRAAAQTAAANNPMTAFYGALKAAPGLARTDVTQQINAALAGDRAATKAAQDQANRQAERAQAAAEGLRDLTYTDPQRIRDDWASTAHFYGALGTGLTGAVGDAQRAEAAQAAQGVGQATGEGAPARANIPTMDLPALHNTLQYADVGLPASSMAEEANNQLAAAAARRAANIQGVSSIADQYRQKTLDMQHDLAAKRAALEAQRPSLYSSALTARQTAARNDLATMTQAQYLFNTMRNTGASITGYDPLTGKPTLERTKVQASIDAASAAAAAKRAQQRIDNLNATTRLNISQQQADAATKRETAYEQNLLWHQKHPGAAGKKSGSVNGLSDAQVRQYGSMAGNIAMTYFQGKPNSKFDNTKAANPKTNPQYSIKPQSPEVALRAMLARHVPLSIALNAIYQYAKQPGSWWKSALPWYTPPNQRKGNESPGVTRGG